MVIPKFIGWELQAFLTLTVNCNLQSCLFFTQAVKILSLWTSFVMKIGPHTLFSDTNFGSPNIHLVKIESSLHSMHWEHMPLWVSAVHGCAGFAGHVVELLSRINGWRFSLWNCGTFDKAWCCRHSFRISMQRSKHNTLAILSQVRLING